MNLIALMCEVKKRGITFYHTEGYVYIQYKSKRYVTNTIHNCIRKYNGALLDALLQTTLAPATPDRTQQD